MSPTPPRRYWLTGAGAGIGAALAEEILKSGAHLAVSARSLAPLKVLAQRYPRQVLVVAGDLTNSLTVRETSECIAREWGSLDTLIVNAGTCEYVDARQLDNSIVEHVMRTNLLASSFCVEAALPLLRSGLSPHVVGIASSVTFLPLPRTEAQSASKAGLRDLFESLRIDVAPQGIDVTLASPGFVDSSLMVKPNASLPLRWPVCKAARHIFVALRDRPLDIPLPALFMAELWPLPKTPQHSALTIGRRIERSHPPLVDVP